MEKIEIAYYLFGISTGILIQILLYECFTKRHRKSLDNYEKLLNQREQLLNQIDTERCKVFKDN